MVEVQMPICIPLKDNSFDQIIHDKDLSDITIQIKGKNGTIIWEFHLHTIVLRRSVVWSKLIVGTEIGGTIVLENINIKMLTKFFKYLYLGELYMETWQDVFSLLELACIYQVDSLKDELQVKLIQFVTLMNVCQILNEAVRLNFQKVITACVDLIVRSCVVIFATGDFQHLSEDSLFLILSDDRLNVPREVDVLLALICWAKRSAFHKGNKQDHTDLFKLISPRLLKAVRLGLISEQDRKLVPKDLEEMIFTIPENNQKNQIKDKGAKEGKDEDESAEEEDDDSLVETLADEKNEANKKPRTPAKEFCLSSHYAHVLLRKTSQAISWTNVGRNAVTVALRFTVTMPIYLGGFLAVYKCDGPAKLHVIIQDTRKESSITYVFKAKNCEHLLVNEAVGDGICRSTCFEPDYPILVSPGEELTVNIQTDGINVNTVPSIHFPQLNIQTGEGPTVRLSMERINTIRKIFFMSACGRCSISTPM